MEKLSKINKFGLIISLLYVIALLVMVYVTNFLIMPKIDYSNIDLTGINKLMIVAHPDDESLWGGAHLIEDDYLVVCITCGRNKERVKEFEKAMSITNDKYIMLGYPDKTNGIRDNWDTVKEKIIEDLSYIIDLKKWKMIVTHNPYGEYGHIHHKMTNSMVTYLAPEDNLYYFGVYYSKKSYAKLTYELPRISDQLLDIKVNDLLQVYQSQKFIFDAFPQMFPHENFVKSTDWSIR